MIKRETKYIIRRILIGVGIALILGFLNTCEVKAQTYTYYFSNTRLHYYDSSTWKQSYLPTTSQSNTWFYPGYGNGTINNLRFYNDVTLTFPNIDMVVFNFNINHSIQDANKPIRAVNFLDNPCYYTIFTSDAGVQWTKEVSAICIIEKAITIQPNSNLVNIDFESINLNRVTISNLNIIDDDDLLQEIKTAIGTTNNRLLNINGNLTDINTILQRTETIDGQIRDKVNDIYTAITNQTTSITQAQQATTDAINDMNDTLKDSNVDSPNSSISQMEQNLPTNSVISDLLTLPIRMFQNILNAVNGSCTSFSLGALFGTNLTLPCINIQNYLGSALWGAIDVIFCGLFVLSMRKKFVEIFENITSLKNGGNELE